MTWMVWFGFAGGWLLVAGPLYQGVLELLEQDINREAVQAAIEGVEPAPGPSNWWWLLPPVMIVKRRRRDAAFWDEAFAALPAEQVALILGVRPKMYGWFLVSLGAAFIATKETGELAHHYEWPWWVLLGIVVLMIVLSVLIAFGASARSGKKFESLVDR